MGCLRERDRRCSRGTFETEEERCAGRGPRIQDSNKADFTSQVEGKPIMHLSRCADPCTERGAMGRGLVLGVVHRMLRHLTVEAPADKEEAGDKSQRDDFHAAWCHRGRNSLLFIASS